MITLEKTRRLEALQKGLEQVWVETNVVHLARELPKMATPTAYFVSQGLLECYQCEPYAVEVDRGKVRNRVQTTLVESYLQDAALLAELVKMAFPTTYAWFAAENPDEKITPESLPLLFGAWLERRPERLEGLLFQHCQHLARSILQAMTPRLEKSSRASWEKLLGLTSTDENDKSSTPRLIEVMNAAHYYDVRDALARRRFERSDDSDWPTARLGKGTSKGYAELRPDNPDKFSFLPPDEHKALVESMWRQREELSDIDADALDALSAVWLDQAQSPEQSALCSVDEILEIRGVASKKGGTGRRGGYEPEQRQEILRALSHIQNLWMNMNEIEVYEGARPKKMAIRSRAFSITDMMGQLRLDGHFEVDQFLFRPGQVFAQFLLGVGRQTALLSAQALRYNPYRQTGEKRLTRYFSWQWRCQGGKETSKSYRVATLLEAILEKVESPFNLRYPNRLRDRFEKMMDCLERDSVIAFWSYRDWDESATTRRGWLSSWLETYVNVEAPNRVLSHYRQIPKASEGLPVRTVSGPLGQRLGKRRRALGLSFSQVAERVGVHRTAIARIEKGERQAAPELAEKLEAWLSGGGSNQELFD